MGLTKKVELQLTDISFSLDGDPILALSSEREKLRMLRECGQDGTFNPHDFAPYKEIVESGDSLDYMKKPYNRFMRAEEGSVDTVNFCEVGGDLENTEDLTFSEWVELGRPQKLVLEKTYEPLKEND